MLQSLTWIILHCCSKLVCIHFGSWDNSREWTVALPEGESIQVCRLKIPIWYLKYEVNINLFNLNDFKVMSWDFIDVLSSKTHNKRNSFQVLLGYQIVSSLNDSSLWAGCLQEDLRQVRRGLQGCGTHYQCHTFRWGVGVGFGSMTESGVFLGPVWFSVSGPDHLQSFCWPVLRVPENCMKVEQTIYRPE